MKCYFFICAFCLFGGIIHAQPGSLDASFGNGGKVLTNIDQTRNIANSILVQPDGKIVVVGYCTPVDYSGYFSLVRYNSDGSLDDNFGLGGVVTTVINGNEDIAFSGVIQPDGKIIVAGYTWTGTDYDFAMIRYNSDGTGDMTFGVGGIITTDIDGRHDKANQIIIEPDGDIILIGYSGDAQYEDIDMAFAKFKSNGHLDQGYGNNGLIVIPVSEPGLTESARAATLQPDGKLVVVGYSDVFDPVNNSLNLIFSSIRLNDNGSLDQTFADNGILKMVVEKWAIGTAVAITNDGKILVLLETKITKYGTTDFTLLRLNASGTVDTSFGTNGFRTISFDNSDDSGSALLVQADQKILAAGYTAVNNGSTVDFALARFDMNGNLDNTFGNGGKVTIDFQGGLDFGAAIALQKNGKIVMAGAARVGNDFDFGLLRFQNDVALPVTLVEFKAKPEDSSVILSWRTFSESNSDYFEIQKSTDGMHWIALDTLRASHFNVTEFDYSAVDHRPWAGRTYYRLKMVDFDKSFAYSTIVTVYITGTTDVLSVYPNPTSGILKLNRAFTSQITGVEIFDIYGNSVTGFRLKANSLDLSSLADGLYNISLKDEHGHVERCKVVLAK